MVPAVRLVFCNILLELARDKMAKCPPVRLRFQRVFLLVLCLNTVIMILIICGWPSFTKNVKSLNCITEAAQSALLATSSPIRKKP